LELDIAESNVLWMHEALDIAENNVLWMHEEVSSWWVLHLILPAMMSWCSHYFSFSAGSSKVGEAWGCLPVAPE
jgi:hypothetical protein